MKTLCTPDFPHNWRFDSATVTTLGGYLHLSLHCPHCDKRISTSLSRSELELLSSLEWEKEERS